MAEIIRFNPVSKIHLKLSCEIVLRASLLIKEDEPSKNRYEYKEILKVLFGYFSETTSPEQPPIGRVIETVRQDTFLYLYKV
jgi:hypothetical protein